MSKQECQIGVIGLGVMGCNLVLNIADHGYAVAGYDKNLEQVQALQKYSDRKNIQAVETIEKFIQSLQSPYLILLLVPAGRPVDAVINDLIPYLRSGDILIDGGNSHFIDTDRRQKTLVEKGIDFLGVGISGGEKGARHGPCMMPGGDPQAYEKIRSIFESIAAHVDGEPCVAYLGPGAAGHYVKMVHNGIEYGLMQLISETYDLLKRGLGVNNNILYRLYSDWNKTKLHSFLLEITVHIFQFVDSYTQQYLVDEILDIAEQKGTGSWTSEEAMKLCEPLPTIDAAVNMRDLSTLRPLRLKASSILKGPSHQFQGNQAEMISQLHHALYAGVILTYAQGMSLMQAASQHYHYQLSLQKVAQIWRGGCIIHSAVLNDIAAAFQKQSNLPTLLLDSYFSQELSQSQEGLRAAVREGIALGIPMPGLMASLGYYDAYRSSWLPANLIQAQRDHFGSHTYKRIDQEGVFHTEWNPSSPKT